MWFIASIEWIVSFSGMRSTINDLVLVRLDMSPIGCTDDESHITEQGSYGQAAIAAVSIIISITATIRESKFGLKRGGGPILGVLGIS